LLPIFDFGFGILDWRYRYALSIFKTTMKRPTPFVAAGFISAKILLKRFNCGQRCDPLLWRG